MTKINAYVGLDVHKETIAIAAAKGGSNEKPESHGTTPNDWSRLQRALAMFGAPSQVVVCYEAGPTGYGLARKLRAAGYRCDVVAPAKTPKISGDRVKTDRRDARKLAGFLRSGHLTAIRIPTEEEEGLRDLIRMREDLKKDESDLRRRLGALMLRHGRIWNAKNLETGKRKHNWTKEHWRWIERQDFDQPGTTEAKLHYIEAIRGLEKRIATVEASIEELALASEQGELIRALCAFKGIRIIAAATLVSEIGDFRRFKTAAQFMSFVGVTPSEHSSGDSRRQGAITKAGNRRVRRQLVESVNTYTKSPHVSRELEKRSKGVSEEVKAIAWKAQRRLWKRKGRMIASGKGHKTTIVAMAREFAGFIWAAAHATALVEEGN